MVNNDEIVLDRVEEGLKNQGPDQIPEAFWDNLFIMRKGFPESVSMEDADMYPMFGKISGTTNMFFGIF